VIILASALVGIGTYNVSHAGKVVMIVLDFIILIIFLFELIVKFLAEGSRPWNFFYSSWNIFDFIIVAASFLPVGGSEIMALRLLRLLRVLKL
jgi:voltage-gated sodium channel